MVLMGYSGARGTLIYEKKLMSKISCQTPFNVDSMRSPRQRKKDLLFVIFPYTYYRIPIQMCFVLSGNFPC
jgi:hypothetical protein